MCVDCAGKVHQGPEHNSMYHLTVMMRYQTDRCGILAETEVEFVRQ